MGILLAQLFITTNETLIRRMKLLIGGGVWLYLKCPKCGYEWEYKGRMFLASCPNCLNKVPTTALADVKRKGIRKSTIAEDVENAEKIIRREGWISAQDLFLKLQVGINKFYWIRKILEQNPEFEVEEGVFAVKGKAPQRTLEAQ